MNSAHEVTEDVTNPHVKSINPNNTSLDNDDEKYPNGRTDTRTSSTDDNYSLNSDSSTVKMSTIAALASDPAIQRLLTENPAFTYLPIPSDPEREDLPHWLDLKKKINIMSVLKEMVGKDLYKLAVPVYLNEPLSMLQRLCEQLEYTEILQKANEESDSCLRMAHVMSFAFSQFQSMINRFKKPFNPVLGETFEFIPVDNSFRYISEQVSHHPPVSAGYAESQDFQWWGDSDLKTTFWGTSLEAKPLSTVHVVLKKNNDHFVYKRPTLLLQNLIVGTMYADNYGDVPFENTATGESGVISFKKRGWMGKNAYEADGFVKDKEGKVVIKLKGKWDSQLIAVDQRTQKEYVLWKKRENPKNYEEQYSFSQFTKQLNYLSMNLVPKLPSTDCRFRPDQRAFEHGDIELAKSEKTRIEQKQRERRAQLPGGEEKYTPRWFKKTVDPKTQEVNYEYIGGYFECRADGKFPDTPDLYN